MTEQSTVNEVWGNRFESLLDRHVPKEHPDIPDISFFSLSTSTGPPSATDIREAAKKLKNRKLQ